MKTKPFEIKFQQPLTRTFSLKLMALLSLLFCLATTSNAFAYLTFLESGELVPAKQYRIGFIPQLITNDSAGLNADATIDTGWNESMASRFLIGTGKMDIHLGGTFKYIPFPDVDKQPAIGIRGAGWYARYKDESYLTFSVAPLLSKKVSEDVGLFIPYVAIPLNYSLNRNQDFFSMQFAMGTEFITPKAKDMTFAAELGVNLKDSYSYIGFYVGYQFDGNIGLPLK